MARMRPTVLKLVDLKLGDGVGLRQRALPLARQHYTTTKYVSGIGFMVAGLGIVYAILDMLERYDSPAGGDTLEVLVAVIFIAFMVLLGVVSVAMLAATSDVKRERAAGDGARIY
jgi:uncharacterized membrane protein YjjB (DUF3815 family)